MLTRQKVTLSHYKDYHDILLKSRTVRKHTSNEKKTKNSMHVFYIIRPFVRKVKKTATRTTIKTNAIISKFQEKFSVEQEPPQNSSVALRELQYKLEVKKK